ncbi:MAG: peptide deformylase, partial [Candidatus Aerophobetes bacterium]|nr:peptide deformylase [Candidatus Aerophobetes bacterium]
MDNLKLRKYGDPILRKQVEWVEKVNLEEKKLLSSMAKIMYKNEGIGLAAPQVGVDKRIIIVHTEKGVLKLINPQI